MLNDLTTTYKKARDIIHNKLNTDGKTLIKDKNILIKILTNGKSEYFIMIIDYKPNFKSNRKVRLINPVKNEIGRINKK